MVNERDLVSTAKNTDIALSKSLSWVLRHGAAEVSLKMSEEGFVDVAQLLRLEMFMGRCELHDIERIVATNSKQRFTLRKSQMGSGLEIRANQGHSIKSVTRLELIPINGSEDAPVAVHGTYKSNWAHIQTEGLSKMSRQHIHFASGVGSSIQTGLRRSADIHIYVDVDKAIHDGIKFFFSTNNVILSPGDSRGFIVPKYFSTVVNVKTGKKILL